MVNVIPRMRRTGAASMAALTLVLALGAPMEPLQAQDSATEARLRKLEAEIRALQRKVFPAGTDARQFTPEIAQQPAASAVPGQPATPAVTDLLTRMDALEAQMARLTGQIEQNSNRIAQLEARVAPAPAAPAAEPAAAPPAAPAAAPAPQVAVAAPSVSIPAATPAKPAAAKPAPAKPAPAKPATPSASRVEAVKAIVKPQTADAGDDEYSYGYRLWDAKFFPEAQQQLQLFLTKYPKHERVSWARNLLGRAYLDEGNASEAAKWFLQNYQADRKGARAPDSLLYLAVSMKALKDSKRACIALAEFSEVYATEAAGRLRGVYESTRNGLSCS